MHSGKIKCQGSTLFLKKLYQVGYLLRLELDKEIGEDSLLFNLLDLIKRYIPDAFYERQQGSEYFFRLSLDEKSEDKKLNLLIADLFDQFDDQKVKEQFGIKTYGLSNTSLVRFLIFKMTIRK